MKLIYNASALPAALMRGATNEQDLLCRAFGKMRSGCEIPVWDREIGDLVGNDYPAKEKYFAYARYNVELSESGLAKLELDEKIDPKSVQPLDGTKFMRQLQKVGAAAAAKWVSPDDFDGFYARRQTVAVEGVANQEVASGAP
jgi:hypothetical protein